MSPKKLTPLLLPGLVLSLVLTACGTKLDQPETLAPQATFGAYDVHIALRDEWKGGFKGAVVLTNTAGEAVKSFEISFKLSGNNPLRNSWGGSFSAPSGDGTITVTSPSYLSAVARGESVEGGFVADNAFSGATVTSLKVNGKVVGGGTGPTDPTDPTGPVEPPDPDPNPDTAVYQQTFENVRLGEYKGKENLSVQDCAGQGRCLKVTYRPDEQGSPRLTFRENLPPASEYTLTYDLRFDGDFEWVKGGKLPGLAPENSVTGCVPLRDNGWSVRLMWRAEGSFMQYLYHQDKTDRCGENVYAEDFTLQKDRWYKVALYVRVNSLGSAADGQVRLFVDGQEVARRDNLRLRNTDTGGLIERFYFSSFYGGSDPSWAPSRPTFAYFDDFTVYPGLRTH